MESTGVGKTAHVLPGPAGHVQWGIAEWMDPPQQRIQGCSLIGIVLEQGVDEIVERGRIGKRDPPTVLECCLTLR